MDETKKNKMDRKRWNRQLKRKIEKGYIKEEDAKQYFRKQAPCVKKAYEGSALKELGEKDPIINAVPESKKQNANDEDVTPKNEQGIISGSKNHATSEDSMRKGQA